MSVKDASMFGIPANQRFRQPVRILNADHPYGTGRERMPPPKDPKKYIEYCKKLSIVLKGKTPPNKGKVSPLKGKKKPPRSKGWSQNISNAKKNPSEESRKRNSEAQIKYNQDHPEARIKNSERQKGKIMSSEFKEKCRDNMILRYKDPIECNKQSERMKGSKNPFFGKKHTEATLKKMQKPKTESHKKKMSESSKNNPLKVEHAKNLAKMRIGKQLSEEHRMNLILSHNDIWYGSDILKRYNNGDSRTTYCLAWNENLRERIRGYWNHKSVLSGITKENNLVKGKPVALSCHHVYYQKKACCEWDEDQHGYFAMINLGTRNKPNLIRYNIKGDPNKFVTLTSAEHTRVQRNDKLNWIKFFEDLIEQQGGQCYLPKIE